MRGGGTGGEGVTLGGVGREAGLPLRVMCQRRFLPKMASSTKSLVKDGSCSTGIPVEERTTP